MKRNLALTIALAALVLAGLNLLSRHPGRSESGPKTSDWHKPLKQLEDRLGRLEMRLKDVAADPFVASPSAAPSGDQASPEATQGNVAALPAELARLASRLDDLTYRIQGLEEDPISRGYAYINSESPQLRLEGITALRRVAQFDTTARDTIRNMLYDSNPRVRMEATDALGDLGDRDAAPLMAQMLSDADPNVRREAIDFFADWGHKESSALIARMLSDPDAGVRREAVVALGTLGASDADSSISQLLSDSSDAVRQQAADVLGRLKVRNASPALLQALNDSNGEVRGEAIASLGEIGATEAIPYLRDMYQRDSGRDRIRLVIALRSLGDEQPFRQEVQRLSDAALSDGDAGARARAIQTLSSFARDQSRDIFTRALQDENDRVRHEAERALRNR
jgi:HEAT repeat protein